MGLALHGADADAEHLGGVALAQVVVEAQHDGGALAQLTPRQRATVVLRFYDDLSERDTAEVLGVSTGTVKSQTHVALARLRAVAPELAELLGEETT